MTAAVAAALAGASGAPASAALTLPAGFETTREVSGLTRATKVVWAPDGRRFIAEKDGRLRVAAPGGTTAQTILDFRSDVNAFLDRGFLGLAIDSDFANNPYLYLLYTYDVNKSTTDPGPDADDPTVSQLRRVTIGANSQVVAQQVLLGSYTSGPCPTPSNTLDCIPSDSTSHSIGTVISAPDGTLFVGSGDGAGFAVADPRSLRTYNEQSMGGKILQIDRNGRGLPGHPFCPSETDLTRVCTKVYAKGLRNPFRFTRLTSGALLVADVGWNTYEELDLITTGGKSFGWPCYEGPIRTPSWRDKPECAAEYAKEGTANAHVGPIHSYVHNYGQHPSWVAIAGPEYTGDTYPAGFRGSIFWGDHGVGFLRRLTLTSGGQVGSMHDFIADEWHGVDLTAAPNGDIAWVDLGGWQTNAAFVDRLVYSPGNAKPNAVAAATPTSGAAPLTVDFDGTGSTDPDGDTLTYSWDFGDGTPDGSGAGPSHIYANNGSYTATLTVSDGRGQSDTDTIQIHASNTPPVPSIDEPAVGFKYRNGVPVQVKGSATDAEQGTLPASAFEWNVRVVHHDHEHSLANPEGVKELQFDPAPDHDADSFIRVRLTVTDSGGASVSTEREIRPETAPLHLRSVPTGAPLSWAGTAATTPFDANSTIGFTGTLSAPATFTSGGVTREFLSWSHGAARVHNFTVPASETTLTATYNARPQAVANSASDWIAVGEPLAFDGTGSSDADGDALTYEWDFGDGSAPSTDIAPTHTYAAIGAYEATLTVTDTLGATATGTVPVAVTDGDPPPDPDPPPDDEEEPPGETIPPAGNPAPGGGETPQPTDFTGPTIRFWRPRPLPRLLAGLVRDPAGVESLHLAVAALSGKGRCRWVTGAPPRLARRSACSPRHWLEASISRLRFELPLPARLVRGRYRVWVLAVDGLGNISRVTADGSGQLRFRITKASTTAESACHAPMLVSPLRCTPFD